jgi:hypothetical protein
MIIDTRLVYDPLANEHYDHGMMEGWRRGREQGRQGGAADAVLLILKARGPDVSEAE